MCWIDTRRLGVNQAEIDSAAAQMQGGASGEQCGPEHARRAAEDAGSAIASFMGVASPWCEMRSKQCRGNQATGRRSVCVLRCKVVAKVESGNANFTTLVRAVGSK